MASKWKAIKQGEEKETLEYVATVAAMVKQRRNELRVTKKGHRSHLPDAGVDAPSTASVLPSTVTVKKSPLLLQQEGRSHQCSYSHSVVQASIQYICQVASNHCIQRTIKGVMTCIYDEFILTPASLISGSGVIKAPDGAMVVMGITLPHIVYPGQQGAGVPPPPPPCAYPNQNQRGGYHQPQYGQQPPQQQQQR
eukprot:scaffold198_cov153-Alexandrium_tamarense.AAC.1